MSARRKPTLGEKLGGWCGRKTDIPKRVPLKERRNCGNCCRLPWFKRGRGPGPPMKAKEKRTFRSIFCCCCKPKSNEADISKTTEPKEGLCRRIFCCKKKSPPAADGAQLQAPPKPANQRKQNPMPQIKPLTKPNFWKRIFCCKCQNKTNDFGSRKSFGSKGDMMSKSRASSIAVSITTK